LQADDLDGLYVQLLRDGDRRSTAGGGLSPSSVRYVHRVLRKALGDAHRKGIVARNVATLADPPKPTSTGEPTVLQVWDAGELSRFLRLTSEHRHHALWVIAAKTGMRRGELLGLRWSDVDSDRSTIAIHRSLGAIGTHLSFSDVKTRSGRRTIDVDARTLALLEQRRQDAETTASGSAGGLDTTSLVFPAPHGGPIHPESVTRIFERLLVKHGLPRIRFHDVRHTHATLLLKAGVPVKVVAERLGHASPGFTLNVYQHVLPGMQAEAAETFDELLSDDTQDDDEPESESD
jgi:integrase